jgi:hypothetical protein
MPYRHNHHNNNYNNNNNNHGPLIAQLVLNLCDAIWRVNENQNYILLNHKMFENKVLRRIL